MSTGTFWGGSIFPVANSISFNLSMRPSICISPVAQPQSNPIIEFASVSVVNNSKVSLFPLSLHSGLHVPVVGIPCRPYPVSLICVDLTLLVRHSESLLNVLIRRTLISAPVANLNFTGMLPCPTWTVV